MSEEQRIVLLPFGFASLPQDARENCQNLIIKCGGDVMRQYPGSLKPDYAEDAPEFAAFVREVGLLRTVIRTPKKVMIVLTVAEVAAVWYFRRDLENALPTLKDALWVVYIDADDKDAFMLEASDYGLLEQGLDETPIWTVPSKEWAFLLLSRASHHASLQDRVIVYFDSENG